ncbi:tRNA modification GTPase MnmE [Ceratobasidium sp. AG-Ba]|nr:tRNA modification GTPase MnmE [Ceratobasidium sp. AG-Ba]
MLLAKLPKKNRILVLPARSTQQLVRGTHRFACLPSRSLHASSRSDRDAFRPDHSLVPAPSEHQTIFALSSPPGKGAVAVVRISGSRSRQLYDKLLRPATSKLEPPTTSTPEPWKLNAAKSSTQKPKKSSTMHSPCFSVAQAAVLRVLSAQPGCRPAEPGEFTRRALLSGRIDLTQAEGLIDLIEAETEAQRKGAMRAAEGGSRRRFEAIRNDIIQCRTLAEAIIDFGEGEEIEDGLWVQLADRTKRLANLIGTHLDDNRRGEILRSGVKLAIFGAPNAGKSSLLNYLGGLSFMPANLRLTGASAARPAAIVTPIAGTTRDVLEVSLDIGGIPVRVSDTAGLRDFQSARNDLDTVERIGIERAKNAVAEADIRLCVVSLENLQSGVLDDEVAGLLTPTPSFFE